MAQELAYMIKPLIGQSPHYLKNTQHFDQQIQNKKLEPGEVMTSLDVDTLFKSVPVDPSIHIIQQRLSQDTNLHQRTNMSIPHIITLLQFCLKNTYFLFLGKYYEQVHGAAMGSPISPLIDNLFMEEFEVKALSTFPDPPRLWLRFIDDTYVISKAEHNQQLLHHISSQDPQIQFTVEETYFKGTLSFLDTLVTIGPNNNLLTTVYRNSTLTDQY